MKTRLALIAIAIGLLSTGPANALTADVTIDSLSMTASDQIVATFSDDGTGEIEDFTIETSPDLKPDSWTEIGAAQFSPEGSGQWTVTIPVDPGGRRAFFRVVKSGVPLTASFSVPTATVREGDAGASITIQFNRAFTGTVRYSIDGTPGSMQVSDETSLRIPIPLDGDLDDGEPGQLRTITVNLELEGAGAGATTYTLGLHSSTTLIIEDNDELWGGTMKLPDKGGEIGIRILRAEDDGVITTCFKTDQGGLIPAAPTGTAWLFNHFDLDLQTLTFTAAVSGITLPAESTIYGAETQLNIVFAAAGESKVTESRIEGEFTINTSVVGRPHLSIAERTGTFSLLRNPGRGGESPAPTDIAP